VKILVCVRQVRESFDKVRIDSSSQQIQEDPSAGFRMNHLDEFAVEEALHIGVRVPDRVVDIITVGPDRASMAVRRALGMGGHKGILILTQTDASMSPFSVAHWIAAVAKDRRYDLILTGVMAEDGMEGQVGPMMAELLSYPYATSVILEQLSSDHQTVYVEREIEGGFRDCVELRLPAVLTVQSGINTPRYPSLSNILRAKKETLELIDAESLEPPQSREELVRMSYPQKSRAGVVLGGTQQEKAEQLLRILSEQHLMV
jgi:electron transfer flavoprotein beta subunit